MSVAGEESLKMLISPLTLNETYLNLFVDNMRYFKIVVSEIIRINDTG
jgi:hypothetical protein